MQLGDAGIDLCERLLGVDLGMLARSSAAASGPASSSESVALRPCIPISRLSASVSRSPSSSSFITGAAWAGVTA